MSRTGLVLLFVIVLPIATAVLAPARLVLPYLGGVAVTTAEGTVWASTLRGVAVREDVVPGGMALGDVTFGLSPLALLTGHAKTPIAASGGALEGQGTLSVGIGGDLEVSGVEASLLLDSLPLMVPLRGRIDITDGHLSMEGRKCTSGRGDVRVAAAPRGISLPSSVSDTLTGSLTCADGDIVMVLVPRAGTVGPFVELRAHPAGRWTAVVGAEPASEEDRQMLALLGFARQNGRMVLEQTGTW